MKRHLLRPVILLVIQTLLCSGIAYAQDIRIFVNNAEEAFFYDQKPFINEDSRTMVPVRFVSESLGATVVWKAEDQTVTIRTQKEETVVLRIGIKTAEMTAGAVGLDTAPVIVNARTMVPLRFVSECLGAKVVWDGNNRIISITTSEFEEDLALVDSDLTLRTPPAGTSGRTLVAMISYRWATPVEPQLLDIEEILVKRYGRETTQPIIAHIRTKVAGGSLIESREWTIKDEIISVDDFLAEINITIRSI